MTLSHHSADVAGKGDAFTWFILGAAAAATQRVSPDDTWKTRNENVFILS